MLEVRTGLEVDDITRLLKVCLDATYHTFQDTHYQTDLWDSNGLACIGHSCQLSDGRNREQGSVHLTPAPRVWKRYVDDTCTAIPSRLFHDNLNGVNEHIQFTLEMEADNSLPFLDVMLYHRPDGSIHTSVYRKPTHTDHYLDFSHHPLEHKRSVVTTLFCRASSITSTMFAANGQRIAPLQEAEDERISSTLHLQIARREERFKAR